MKVVIVLFLSFFPYLLFSQTPTDSTEVTEKKKYVMTKSPTGAIYRSIALPGWGQWYVERYWKAPLFFGATAFTITNVIVQHNRFTTRQQEFDNSTNPIEKSVLLQQKENNRNQRDLFSFFTLLIYGVAAIDAYTDAHLFDFTVTDNAKISTTPYLGFNNDIGLRFVVEF
jgi:hypothetical protein